MASNNEYKVKVGVEFNAIMTKVNSALDSLQDRLKKLGSLTGAKDVTSGLSEGLQKIVNGFNELKDFTITPKNLNEYIGKLQVLEEELKAVGLSSKDINQSLFNDKNNSAAENIQKANDEIKKLESSIEALNKKKAENSATNPFTEKDAQDLKNYEQELQKAQKSLSGYTAYQTRLKHASESLGVTEEQLAEILRLLAQAHREAADASEKQKEGQQQLDNNKLADTIKNQVNQYIGLAAIYRYTKKYIQDLVQTYKEFDQSLVAIAAVTGQTRDQMWANIGVYNKMAQSLGTTTQEVINASKLYYQQGLTTTSVLKLTEETVKLATIAELDSADATEYLTTAMNGFKLSAEESTRVTDVWANLAAKTASDVDELAIAISKVASLAENAGMEIETASAFLNQMIETTREAPENLGTALKTIIARFQELKTSEEALSDGVDANKVERALKSAGVALRDASGQFRDFDDVILELSSKWDGLDRNTQRYIATIAAGSRQQSRFIALVSDYEGLLRNVNYAYDSLGSADAQMAVFQEGLAASTNRLKAAWEGLYTSWSESATVISKVIDGMASLVSTLADLGAGTSAVIAGAGLFTTAILAKAAALKLEDKALGHTLMSTKEYIQYQIEATKEIIKNNIARLQAIAPYIAIAAAIAALIVVYIRLKNYETDYIKSLEKEQQQLKQLAAQEKDRASSAGVLLNELEQVKNSEEGIEEVRQKIIDQFGDQITGINLEKASYEELTKALKEYQSVQNNLASKDYIAAALEQQKIDALNSEDVKTFMTRVADGKGHFKLEPAFFYNGEVYNNADELLTAMGLGSNVLSGAEKSFVAKTILDSNDIKNEVDISQGIIETFIDSLSRGELSSLFDENGLIDKDSLERINSINNSIVDIYNSLDATSKIDFTNFINGEYGLFNTEQLQAYIAELQQIDPAFAEAVNAAVTAYQTGIANALQTLPQTYQTLLTNGFTLGGQKAFTDAWNNLASDPSAQAAFGNAIKNLIAGGMNPEDITATMIESLGDVDLATTALQNLVDGLGNLKDPTLLSYFEQLRQVIGESNAVFEEGKSVVDAYYGSMADLADLQKGGMSNEDYLAKLYSEAAALAEVTDATYEQIVAEMLKATTLDESGQMILQQTDLLAQWAEQQYIASDQTVEAKKAELLAYAASMDAIADELDAMADSAEGRIESGQISQEAADAMIEAAVKTGIAENNMGAAAQKAWEKLEGSKNTSPYSIVQQDLVSLTKKLNNVSSVEGIRALANEARAKALTARAQAAQLNINKLANSFNKAGKSAGKAAKETDKYKDALKELNDKLKEAKEEAERYIDAVLDALDEKKKDIEDAQKLMEEAFEAERRLLKIQLQAWRDYNEAQQQGALDALELQGKAADMYFNQEIAAIQAKIDALDDEAEAEDRLLKLQKARDDYNKAQNSRTRLVLTKGAGWIFKTDQNEVTNARKALNDVQREIQKANYQKQLDDLQAQATAWQEIAEKIGESAAEAGELAEKLEQFRNGDNGYNDFDAYSKAVEDQQKANDTYAALIEKIDKQLEQADWTFEDYQDSQDYEDAYKRIFNKDPATEINGKTLEKQLTDFINKLKENQVIYEEQEAELKKIADTEKFYNLQKTQLGLTQAQLDKAEEIRQAIFDSYDKSSENLGLGEDSKYYKSNILGLIEETKKLAEQIAELEAKQALEAELQANTGGGGGAGGGGSSGGGGGTIVTTPVNSGGNNTSNTNPAYGNRVLDAIRNGQYGSINNNQAVNAIRDSYTAGAYSTSYANNITTYHFNIDTVNTKATDAAGFAADLKRLNYLN